MTKLNYIQARTSRLITESEGWFGHTIAPTLENSSMSLKFPQVSNHFVEAIINAWQSFKALRLASSRLPLPLCNANCYMWCTSSTTTSTFWSHLWWFSQRQESGDKVQPTKNWRKQVEMTTKHKLKKEVENQNCFHPRMYGFFFLHREPCSLRNFQDLLPPFFSVFFDLKRHDSRCFKTRNLRGSARPTRPMRWEINAFCYFQTKSKSQRTYIGR